MKKRANYDARAANWADLLPSVIGYSKAPVDLYAVARHRRILQLRMRLIVPRGALVPVERGFEVYLRDPTPRDIDISGAEPSGLLSTRQRFSLAHEIAHTFFFTPSEPVPMPDESISDPTELEDICNRTAARILVPTGVLQRRIRERIGDPGNIDAEFVRSAATDFRTSIPAILERLNMAEPSYFERGVILVRRSGGDAQIRASYFGVGLLPILPRPKKYIRVMDWLRDFPTSEITSRADSDWTISRRGRCVSFMKREIGSRGDFLLQVQAAS